MTIIKSYTDLEQSKKLAEVISPESADFCWGIDDETLHYNNSPYPCAWKNYSCKEYYIPCWSLAALLDLIPEYIRFNEHTWKFYLDHRGMYYMNADTYDTNKFSSNIGILINDAYEIILKLKEKNLL